MSRYVLSTKPDKLILQVSDGPYPKVVPTRTEKYNLRLVFGFDHAVGLFFQVLEETCNLNACEESATELRCDQDSLFHRVSKSHLLEIITYYASAEELERLKHQLALLTIDFPF